MTLLTTLTVDNIRNMYNGVKIITRAIPAIDAFLATENQTSEDLTDLYNSLLSTQADITVVKKYNAYKQILDVIALGNLNELTITASSVIEAINSLANTGNATLLGDYIVDNQGYPLNFDDGEVSIVNALMVVDSKIGPIDTAIIRDSRGVAVGLDPDQNNDAHPPFTLTDMVQAQEDKLGYDDGMIYPMATTTADYHSIIPNTIYLYTNTTCEGMPDNEIIGSKNIFDMFYAWMQCSDAMVEISNSGVISETIYYTISVEEHSECHILATQDSTFMIGIVACQALLSNNAVIPETYF